VALARQIPADADPYSRALKLIAENKAGDAASLLSDPTKLRTGDLQNLYLASGLALRYMGRYEDAIESYKKGLSVNKNNRDLLDEMAWVLALDRKYNEADKAFKRAIAVKTEQLGSQHPELADTLERYQQVLRKSNKLQRADEIGSQVASIRSAGIETKGGSSFYDERAANARVSALDDYEPQTTTAVTFKVNGAVLTPELKTMLDELAMKAFSAKGYVLEVSGYSDSTGSTNLNRHLSQRRADAVIRYLIENHNIPLRRIITPYGYGETNPVADNATHAGRQNSRRVEIKLLVNKGLSPSTIRPQH